MQMIKRRTHHAQYTVFNIFPCPQDVESMIIIGTNYGNIVRAGLNIQLPFICFTMQLLHKMHCTCNNGNKHDLPITAAFVCGRSTTGCRWDMNVKLICLTLFYSYKIIRCVWQRLLFRVSRASFLWTINYCEFIEKQHGIFLTATSLHNP